MNTFVNRLLVIATILVACSCSGDEANAQPATDMGKTLVVYYSFTNNVRTIVGELTKQITADVVEVQPAEESLDYAANNYAIGSSLIAGIRNNPDDPASYPAIKDVAVDLTMYDNIVVATPLWWSQMAAPMQSFLFHNGAQMAGKRVALIVSSASSNISSTVADARRLLPEAEWAGEALWINNNNRSRTATLVTEWLAKQDFQTATHTMNMYITIGGRTQRATLAAGTAAQQLATRLQDGPVTVTLSSSGGFEIWGPLGFSLPTSNRQMTAQPGDIVLYEGSNICLFYGQNSWSYTPLGRIEGLSTDELRTFLRAGESNISVTLALTEDATGISRATTLQGEGNTYTIDGREATAQARGVVIENGRKTIR